MSSSMSPSLPDDIAPVIVACRAPEKQDDFLRLCQTYKPYGLLIFRDNARNGAQSLRRFIAEFKDAVGNPDAHIAIDHEGGHVWRLFPEDDPSWSWCPPAPFTLAELFEADPLTARHAITEMAQRTATQLSALGITVNYAPMVDIVPRGTSLSENFSLRYANGGVAHHETSSQLHQRLWGATPETIIETAGLYGQILHQHGIKACLKHAPGLGASEHDTHFGTAIISSDRDTLRDWDGASFHALGKNAQTFPYAMTSHARYDALDPHRAASISPTVIHFLRQELGLGQQRILCDAIDMVAIDPSQFDTDSLNDFGMPRARKGALANLTKTSLSAGCDAVIYANLSRSMAELETILEAAHGA